jgi:chromosome segregation and condensation protein ScpB
MGVSKTAKTLTKAEAGVLMAVGYFQPVTRAELSDMFGREISRDLIASLRSQGLIAAGPRSPQPGAPYAYVTTPGFLSQFGFESLQDLPNLERLQDAALLEEGDSPSEALVRFPKLDDTVAARDGFSAVEIDQPHEDAA